MGITVSFCIVNWNTSSLTVQLIKSIYQTVKNNSFEIIVIDNNSTDDSVEQIEKFFAEVILIKNHKNKGYGAALNQGIKISKGKYIMALNSDIIFLDYALDNMVSFLGKHQEAGTVGPILLDKKGNIDYSFGRFPKPWLIIIEQLLGKLTPKKIRPLPLEGKPDSFEFGWMEVDNIKGACMLVPRKVVESIGLFDENFFAYFEESDWCLRMEKSGFKRYLISNAKVIHFADSSFGQIPVKARRYFEESKKIYLEKHYGKIVSSIFGCVNAWAKLRHKVKILSFG
jgi:hypothetical protein